MFSRTRRMDLAILNGYYKYHYNGIVYPSSTPSGQKTTTDWVGNPRGDNPFSMSRYDRQGGWSTGSRMNFGYKEEWYQYLAPPASTNPGAFTPPASSFRNINSVIASHHPGEPAIALPVFLFELKDVPDMLKHAFGRAKAVSERSGSYRHLDVRKYLSSPKASAEDWLNYKFGWAPLLSDLSDLAGLTAEVNKRAIALKKAKRGFIRRQSDIGSWSETLAQTSVPFLTQGISLFGTRTESRNARRWVSSRWSVDRYMFEAAQNGAYLQLYRAALGLDLSLTHAWDAMPWSWLIDWFTGMGDIIHANANRFGIRFHSACLMSHQWATCVVTPNAVPSYLKCTPSIVTSEYKTRTLVAPSLNNLGINVFSPSQLATLAALKVTRRR